MFDQVSRRCLMYLDMKNVLGAEQAIDHMYLTLSDTLQQSEIRYLVREDR